MTNRTPAASPSIEIFRSLKRGGLSLWLNRRSLMPLTLFPLGVTFLTLVLARLYAPDDVSPLMLAVIQLPADFSIGLFCALIILIIMHAPKQNGENGQPVVFTMNVASKKPLLIAGAIAHTLFGYFYLGGMALFQAIAEPFRSAMTAGTPIPLLSALGMVVFIIIALYAVRFALLPVLVVGQCDVKDFYRRNRAFGLSLPVFFIKLLAMLGVGFVFLLPMSMAASGGVPPTGAEAEIELSPIAHLVIDLSAAVSALAAHAWTYAALAVGLRSMLESSSGAKRS